MHVSIQIELICASPVALSVRQVVAQVGAVHRHGLAVGQAPHVLPHHLFVPETGPAVGL